MVLELPTVQWSEIVWTLTALPGLILWFINFKEALTTLRALRSVKDTSGVRLWAKFSVLLTSACVFVEFTFVTIGVAAMFTRPAPGGSPLVRLILTVGFVLASMLISYIAFQWRLVDNTLIRIAERKDRRG